MWHWPCLHQQATDIWIGPIGSRWKPEGYRRHVIASAAAESPSTHVMTRGRRAEVGFGTAAVVTYGHDRVRRRRRPRRRRNVAGRRLVAAAALVRHGRRRFSGPRVSGRCGVVCESSAGVIVFSICIYSWIPLSCPRANSALSVSLLN